MCFTPAISLTTAIIEFIVASIILIFFRKSLVNKYFSIFIYFLGFYQFTEFMLCTSNNPVLWAKIGFITYVFLPAMGLHFVMRFFNKKFKYELLYIPPIVFSLIAIFAENFILRSECGSVFIIVKTLLFNSSNWISSILYWLYYFGFILIIFFLLLIMIKKEKNKIKRKMEIVVFLALILSLVPAVILIMVFPLLNIMFPSIYCEFALLFTIAALIVSYLDSQI